VRFLIREVELTTTAGRIIQPIEEAREAGVAVGETAHEALSRSLRSAGGQIIACVSEADGRELVATVRRDDRMFQLELTPE
jgi:hypothetical protein